MHSEQARHHIQNARSEAASTGEKLEHILNALEALAQGLHELENKVKTVK